MKLSLYLTLVALCLICAPSANADNIEARHIADSQTAKPRIIALAPHIVELLFEIGAGEQIIATTDHADYPLAAQKIPSIGSSMRIQLERVIELQPDLIIAWKSGNPTDDLARLIQLGFKVVYSQPESFNDVADEIRLFGQLSGHSKRAEQLATKFAADLKRLKKQYSQKKPLIGFYEVWPNPLTTIAKDSWPQQFLDICKISNPFYDATISYPQVNIEQVLQSPVEIIIQPLAEKQSGGVGYSWQKWPILSAVKHQQIITPNADIIHRMSTRSLIALADLCHQADKSRTYYQKISAR